MQSTMFLYKLSFSVGQALGNRYIYINFKKHILFYTARWSFFVDNQHYFFLINQTFKPFISWTNSENSTFDFKYFIPCTFDTDLSCLVSSGLFLSGDCVANDNTVKHKVMVQISKHFVIVVVSMKNKKSSLKSTTHVSTKFYNAKNNMKKPFKNNNNERI